MKKIFKVRDFNNMLKTLEVSGRAHLRVYVQSLYRDLPFTLMYDRERRTVIAKHQRGSGTTHTGYSRCHPDDKFNLRFGSRMAISEMIKDVIEYERDASVNTIKYLQKRAMFMNESLHEITTRYKLNRESRKNG